MPYVRKSRRRQEGAQSLPRAMAGVAPLHARCKGKRVFIWRPWPSAPSTLPPGSYCRCVHRGV